MVGMFCTCFNVFVHKIIALHGNNWFGMFHSSAVLKSNNIHWHRCSWHVCESFKHKGKCLIHDECMIHVIWLANEPSHRFYCGHFAWIISSSIVIRFPGQIMNSHVRLAGNRRQTKKKRRLTNVNVYINLYTRIIACVRKA